MNTGRQLALDVLSGETHETFRRIIRSVEPGRRLTANSLRDLLDAADIPETARGGLFAKAVQSGLLRPVTVVYEGGTADVYVPSSGESAKGARVRLYERT